MCIRSACGLWYAYLCILCIVELQLEASESFHKMDTGTMHYECCSLPGARPTYRQGQVRSGSQGAADCDQNGIYSSAAPRVTQVP